MKNKAVKIVLPFALALIVGAAFISGCALSSYDWFVSTIKKQYYYEVDTSAFEGTDLKELAAKHLDRYSAYYTAEEYKAVINSNAGSKSGMGISYAFVDGKGIYISSVVGNSPAYKSGLRAGEWLESGSANGTEITFNSAEDFSKLVSPVADGTEITLNSADGKSSYGVAKAEYTATYTTMSTNSEGWIFTDSEDGGLALIPEYSEIKTYLPDGTAYINLSQFYGTAAKEFDLLIKKFNAENCTSLILDLRTNGGGYVSVMQDMAYNFSGSTKTLAMLSRNKYGKEEKFNCTKVNANASVLPDGVKVYVLANAGTASASEALIGAMVSYGVLGYKNIFVSDYGEEYIAWLESTGQEVKTARSYGKGIMQSSFVHGLSGEALKLTTAGIFWPDKKTSIHDRGVSVADGCTPVLAEWEHTRADEELQRVVALIAERQ